MVKRFILPSFADCSLTNPNQKDDQLTSSETDVTNCDQLRLNVGCQCVIMHHSTKFFAETGYWKCVIKFTSRSLSKYILDIFLGAVVCHRILEIGAIHDYTQVQGIHI